MKKVCSFYLNNILNKKIYDEFDECVGILKDVYVTTEKGYPRVIGYKVKVNREVFNYEFRNIEFFEEQGEIITKVKGVRDIIPRKYSYLLSKHLLNKKIVDINGKKVIKVDDLTLVQNVSEIKVVAVISGTLASARRIGIEKFVGTMYKVFHRKLKDSIVMWESVESIEMVDNNLKISLPYEKLSKLHPADIADILEELDTEDRKKVFESLDKELAADTLEEVEPEVQKDILKNVNSFMIREVLDTMPNDEIADMLEDMEEEEKERILLNLDKEDENEVRNLMQYEEETVGSIMNKEFITLNVNITAEETIEILRETKPDEESIYNIYIIDEKEKLQGIVSLVDLVTSSPESRLEDIMYSDIACIKDDDSIEKAIENALKYDLLSIPVVDHKEKLCGIVIINDILDEVVPLKVKRKFKKAV
ncbi:magnesium transporter [Haloimpatiens lingqiaonensis]|uniref:magnesium transporter n=1 Tax=Haloimpatiens lingqiaonensis TaxID=1380675 RepID=UPI0010FDB072|nr:CBS domain-containing protein [Haloimpatiens lingqiaonensis]